VRSFARAREWERKVLESRETIIDQILAVAKR
jgi:hypothetical protein